MSFKKLAIIVVGIFVLIHSFSTVFTSDIGVENETVLMVTAHPDDETMFFGPTIQDLIAHDNNLHFLVLCSGNATGIGALRAQEMVKAGKLLGVPGANVEVIDDPRMPDSMTTNWDTEVVKTHVLNSIKKTKAKVIVTFDDYGISNHPNHQSASKGALAAARQVAQKTQQFRVLTLNSVSIFRKYLFTLDSLVSRALYSTADEYTIVSSSLQYHLTNRALQEGHVSQMVWFRKLWIRFSRYMVVNTLKEVDLGLHAKHQATNIKHKATPPAGGRDL